MGCKCLTAKTVQGPALAFQSIHNIEGCDSLAASMLCVCDGITNNVFEKDLEHSTSFLVDEARNALYSSTASKTADSRFCDTCKDQQ